MSLNLARLGSGPASAQLCSARLCPAVLGSAVLGSASTTGAGIRETKRPTTEIIQELTLAAYQNLREGKMALFDYLFYVGRQPKLQCTQG